MIDEDGLRRYADSKESVGVARRRHRYRRDDVIIPSYYSSQNFHGIRGGYLTYNAAVTYDPITQYILPPNETIVHQALVDAVRVKPRRILNLGCGTGSITLMLKPTQDVWWINQVTSGVKPIATENVRHYTPTSVDNNDLEGFGSPAFGTIA
ncbi:hypothetical protein [Nostoc sp. KVJ3]|uniref:hypothetical protein n=1 Tax=Nostoc sp. KVJ3 TaxID=457945 RepID=UPI0022380848|nr:hypothetical protein [Nostoc sp. KVJ3]